MQPEHPLERLDREMQAPPGRRLELLEEVDADAQALQSELMRRGRGPRQAREAALRQLVPEGEAVTLLEVEHAPPLGRWVRAGGWAARVERLGIASITLFAGLAAALVIRPGTLGSVSALAWPQVVVVALLASNWAQAAFDLWIRGDLRADRRRLLWRRQIGLMVTAVALGAIGAAWEAYVALGALEAGEGGAGASAVWGMTRRIVSFAGVGLAAATVGLFGWLSLTPRLITDEVIERRISTFFNRTRPPSITLTPTEPGRN